MSDSAFLAELAARYGTPAYVYDLDAIRQAAQALRSDLPQGARLLYSVKANPHPLLIETLCREGLDAEVSSLGEVIGAIGGGCPPERLLHTGPGKSAAEITASIEAGVRAFSIESVTDRARLALAAAESGVDCEYLVRLNGPAGSGRGSLRMTGKPTPFGVDITDADALAELFRPSDRARPVGTHTFFATNVADQNALLAEFEQALRTVAMVSDQTGFTPRIIDLGGGFAAPNAQPGQLARHSGLAEALSRSLDVHASGWRQGNPQPVFESGRYLVATSGTLLTRILDVKHSGTRKFTVLDAGVNALGGMSGLGRLMAPRAQPRLLDDGLTTESADTTLVGPLCTPLDILNGTASLGVHHVGQVIAIPNVGAYGLTASLLGFLSHPAPVEIVHDGIEVLSARRLTLQPVELTIGKAV